MSVVKIYLVRIACLALLFCSYSCEKEEVFVPEQIAFVADTTDVVAIQVVPKDTTSNGTGDKPATGSDVEPKLELTVSEYALLDYGHQSAAVYGNYAFVVKGGVLQILMYDMERKKKVYSLLQKSDRKDNIYHSNQSCFGIQKYDPEDMFPVLYVSQRSKGEGRCFTEVYRIIPLFNADGAAIIAFRVELVQEIYFPQMTKENSMGNVNCVIDRQTGAMYTYSRNNETKDSNYGQCKISQFVVPDVHTGKVVLEDSDIRMSFMIDARASNMQGGCIVDDVLYIGQGYPYANYVYLNVVDLKKKKLVQRFDLLAIGARFEPEGCFYYDGSVMLCHTAAISRMEIK